MNLESQFLVREFNRRLRAALSSAPNHVRVEAALEVESHVVDVLSRQKSTLSEPERVAEILSGFGAPEEYARAIMAQLPDVQVVNVRTGVREVGLAAVDLIRGLWRLLVALVSRIGHSLLVLLHWLNVGLVWSLGKIGWGARAARGPASRVLRWLGGNVNWVRRGAHLLRLWLGRLLLQTAEASRGVKRVVSRLWRWGMAAVRFTLKAAAYTALGGLALASFALAGFAALVPDVAGFGAYQLRTEVEAFLTELRSQTVFHFDSATQAQFTKTGNSMLIAAVLFGLILIGLIVLMALNARQSRRTVLDRP